MMYEVTSMQKTFFAMLRELALSFRTSSLVLIHEYNPPADRPITQRSPPPRPAPPPPIPTRMPRSLMQPPTKSA